MGFITIELTTIWKNDFFPVLQIQVLEWFHPDEGVRAYQVRLLDIQLLDVGETQGIDIPRSSQAEWLGFKFNVDSGC